MIDKKIYALKLALEALVAVYQGKDKPDQVTYAIASLRKTLAEQSVQRMPLTDEQHMIEMIDAAMVASASIYPPITRSQCEIIIRAALNIRASHELF